ncbi:MAG: CHASE3 domain-containing protein, partial [Flavobacteriales bacterium]|nr:CHASE3 domain-containing protein [Flavobacteriales bacterium]
EPFHRTKGSMASEVDHLEELMGATPESEEEMERLRAGINDKFRYTEALIENQRNRVTGPGLPDFVLLKRGKEVMDSLRITESLMVERQTAVLRSQEAQGRELERSGPASCSAFWSVLLCVIALLLAWTFAGSGACATSREISAEQSGGVGM